MSIFPGTVLVGEPRSRAHPRHPDSQVRSAGGLVGDWDLRGCMWTWALKSTLISSPEAFQRPREQKGLIECALEGSSERRGGEAAGTHYKAT